MEQWMLESVVPAETFGQIGRSKGYGHKLRGYSEPVVQGGGERLRNRHGRRVEEFRSYVSLEKMEKLLKPRRLFKITVTTWNRSCSQLLYSRIRQTTKALVIPSQTPPRDDYHRVRVTIVSNFLISWIKEHQPRYL